MQFNKPLKDTAHWTRHPSGCDETIMSNKQEEIMTLSEEQVCSGHHIDGLVQGRRNYSALASARVQTKAYDITPGPRLNIKTVLSTYGDFHVKDKTAVRTSYL